MNATPIKALSLWQPWATLMAIGAKRIETRSWDMGYKGWLAIHAAKKWSRELEAMCQDEFFLSALGRVELLARGLGRDGRSRPVYHRVDGDGTCHPFPFGAIVALVHVTGTRRTVPQNTPSGREREFGDYTPGRYQFLTDRVIDLGHDAIPTPGRQQLFTLPFDIERRLARRIEEAA